MKSDSISEAYGVDIPDSTGFSENFDRARQSDLQRQKVELDQQQQYAKNQMMMSAPDNYREIANQQGFVPTAAESRVESRITQYLQTPSAPQQG